MLNIWYKVGSHQIKNSGSKTRISYIYINLYITWLILVKTCNVFFFYFLSITIHSVSVDDLTIRKCYPNDYITCTYSSYWFRSTRQASTKLQIRIIESLWEIDIILTEGATIHSCIHDLYHISKEQVIVKFFCMCVYDRHVTIPMNLFVNILFKAVWFLPYVLFL